jgi:hypothetical protein
MDYSQLVDITIWVLFFIVIIASYTTALILILTVGVVGFYIVRSFIWKGAFK